MKLNHKLVPLERLYALHEFKTNELCKREKSFYVLWQRKELCKCTKDFHKDKIMYCNHIKQAIKSKFQKERKELWNLTLAMMHQSPRIAQLDKGWLENFEL